MKEYTKHSTETGSFYSSNPFKLFPDRSLETLTTEQLLGKLITDLKYRITTYTVFSDLETFLKINNAFSSTPSDPIDYSIYENKKIEYELIEIPENPSDYKLKFNVLPFFDPFADHRKLITIYSKLKEIFTILKFLLAIESSFFVYVIILFSQQFGGNRDLPVHVQ